MKIYKYIVCAILVAFSTNIATSQKLNKDIEKKKVQKLLQNQNNSNNNFRPNADTAITSSDNESTLKYDAQETQLIFNCANIYLNKGETTRALPLLIDAAQNGNVDAQYLVGSIYATGDEKNGILPNGIKAIQYLQMAEKNGNAEAMALLSKIYRQGKIIARDDDKAKQYAEKSYNAGSINGSLQLALYYDLIEDNYQQAKQYYHIAADDPEHPIGVACNNLAICYETAKDPADIDLDKAKFYYQKAIDLGYQDAVQNLENLNKRIRSTSTSNQSSDDGDNHQIETI